LEKSEQLRYLQRAVRERRYLLKNPDVLGVGVGYRERNGVITDELALIVYVVPGRKQTSKEEQPKSRRIPEHVTFRVRGHQINLPVDIVEADIGKLHRDVVSGVSVGNQLSQNIAGTVGWIAQRRSDKKPVFCSNYHVLIPFPPAGTNQETLTFTRGDDGGEVAVMPSIKDGGDPNASRVGEVVRGRRDIVSDVAIVLIDPDEDWTPRKEVIDIGAYGAPREITTADLASGPIPVMVRGRTTGHVLHGNIITYPNQLPFAYPDLDDPLLMSDLIATDIQTQEGDSGALLLDEQLRPLGILLGMGGTRSYFIHIANIMSSMQIEDLA
jgi:hypothetical protein